MYDKEQMTYTKQEYDKLRTDLAAEKDENRFLERQYKNTDSRIERLLRKLTSQNKYKADLKRYKDALEGMLHSFNKHWIRFGSEPYVDTTATKVAQSVVMAEQALNPKEKPNENFNTD